MKPTNNGSILLYRIRNACLFILITMLFVPLAVVSAEAPGPEGIIAPPAGLALPEPEISDTSAAVRIPGLKAVLLGGPIDGDQGPWTREQIGYLETAARQLEAYGVQVYRFYTPNNDWAAIREAARGAHFLLYRGHGVQWNDSPTPTVGGLSLEVIHSPDHIRADLELHPNAIIMLYACFTAGSAKNDAGPISGQEAVRRVAEYSDPFFDNSAAGYFANWWGEAFTAYVNNLFAGQTLRQAYENFFDFNPETVERYSFPGSADMAVYVDKDDWDGIKYNNAFAGRPEETLKSLFDETSLNARLSTLPAQVYLPAVIND